MKHRSREGGAASEGELNSRFAPTDPELMNSGMGEGVGCACAVGGTAPMERGEKTRALTESLFFFLIPVTACDPKSRTFSCEESPPEGGAASRGELISRFAPFFPESVDSGVGEGIGLVRKVDRITPICSGVRAGPTWPEEGARERAQAESPPLCLMAASSKGLKSRTFPGEAPHPRGSAELVGELNSRFPPTDPELLNSRVGGALGCTCTEGGIVPEESSLGMSAGPDSVVVFSSMGKSCA